MCDYERTERTERTRQRKKKKKKLQCCSNENTIICCKNFAILFQ